MIFTARHAVHLRSIRFIFQQVTHGLIQLILEMLMLGNKYLYGVDSHSERLTSIAHTPFLYNMNPNQVFLGSCDIYPHELPTILKHNFAPLSYPTHNHPNNPFCPICLKFVPPETSFLGYFAAIFGKTYLAHQLCLLREDSNCLNTIIEGVTHTNLSIINSINQARSFCFGQKEYFIEMEISHPLTSKPFFTLKNKIQTNGSFLVWNFRKFNEPESCFPNIIAFPYPDFQIQISFCKMSERDGRRKHKAFVNLQKLKLDEDKLVKISTEDFDLIVRVIFDEWQKVKTIDEMNFKYQHPRDINLPLVEIVKLQLKLPNNDSDQDNQYICSRENSSITELLNENSHQTSTIRSSSLFEKDKKSAYLSQVVSQRSFEKEKVDLNRLISSGGLSDYVKNNVQSRNFQAFLGEVTHGELNDILRALSHDFCELVTHEYANYMMQKLFTICNTQQRVFILDKLVGSIPMLVKNKQGTHTLQSLVALLTQEEEHCMVIEVVRRYLNQLSEHPNATHFVQKIINVLPIRLTLPFFHLACQSFLKFALNKNAMCVLKQMMKKLKDIQDSGFKSVSRNEVEDIQRKMINAAALNIHHIIEDCYGNYVVQFCYEYFGSERCARITEMIIDRFPQYSMQKYSGSVVLKCVQSYWGSKQTIQKLKYPLNGNSIMDMYRNKQGSKILLTIMEKYENTAIREKIYSQVVMAEPAKFQHDRWGVTLGSRSGTVGTSWMSFPQAVKPSHNKKKKHYNIIQ